MSFRQFMQTLKDNFQAALSHVRRFLATNWKELLAASGAIGGVILWLIEKLGEVSSACWLGFALLFWLFIFLAAAFSLKGSRGIYRAFVAVVFIAGLIGVAYFGLVTSIYFFAEAPSPNGQVLARDSAVVTLNGKGVTADAYKENFVLAFSRAADYVETDFIAATDEVKELLLTYDNADRYKDQVKKSDNRLFIERATPDLKLSVFLLATLPKPVQDPTIQVKVETTFSGRNRWWRLKRWIYERYQD